MQFSKTTCFAPLQQRLQHHGRPWPTLQTQPAIAAGFATAADFGQKSACFLGPENRTRMTPSRPIYPQIGGAAPLINQTVRKLASGGFRWLPDPIRFCFFSTIEVKPFSVWPSTSKNFRPLVAEAPRDGWLQAHWPIP